MVNIYLREVKKRGFFTADLVKLDIPPEFNSVSTTCKAYATNDVQYKMVPLFQLKVTQKYLLRLKFEEEKILKTLFKESKNKNKFCLTIF
jgi:hypothetical protein